jgi:hypothetical protein
MESDGLYNQSQLITNINSRITGGVSLFGSYVFTEAMSNTDGLNTFPAMPDSMAGEYDPALADIPQRVSFGGTRNMKWDFSLSPLLTVYSGQPFDLTVGHDLYGDTLFNGRPGSRDRPQQARRHSNTLRIIGSEPYRDERLLPRNFGRGPGIILFNFRVAKAFAFGRFREEGQAAGSSGEFFHRVPTGPFSTGGAQNGGKWRTRRYTVSLSMSVRNDLNHNNPGPIIGNIASPRFGQANQPPYGVGILGGTGFSESANNRRLEMQVRFNF